MRPALAWRTRGKGPDRLRGPVSPAVAGFRWIAGAVTAAAFGAVNALVRISVSPRPGPRMPERPSGRPAARQLVPSPASGGASADQRRPRAAGTRRIVTSKW